MRYLFLLLLVFFNKSSAQDSLVNLLPKKIYRLSSPLLRVSCEVKINDRTTITPQIGFGFMYQSGSSYIGGPRFSEFGLIPVIDTDFKYYLTLNNSKKGVVNCLYKGSYISFHPYLSSQLLGNYKYIYSSPEYGFQINLGRAIQKKSNWYFNYYLGYNLFSKAIKTQMNNAQVIPSQLSLGGCIGFSL